MFDKLRKANPHLGFALYAYAPSGSRAGLAADAVTLEVHTPDGEVFSFYAPTAEAAITAAFPEVAQQPAPAAPEPENTQKPPIIQEQASVFD